MKKCAVMWLIAAEGVSIRSVWDSLHATLNCNNKDMYSSSVHKDEIELCFDYKGDEQALLYEALNWGRAEQALTPICKSIHIYIGEQPKVIGEKDGDI